MEESYGECRYCDTMTKVVACRCDIRSCDGCRDLLGFPAGFCEDCVPFYREDDAQEESITSEDDELMVDNVQGDVRALQSELEQMKEQNQKLIAEVSINFIFPS